jgi:hypothetical protein
MVMVAAFAAPPPGRAAAPVQKMYRGAGTLLMDRNHCVIRTLTT